MSLPKFTEEHCEPDCPFLKSYEHPYHHLTAWCWKQARDLDWHDYWLADCIQRDPDEQRIKFIDSGVTKAVK